MVFVPRDLDRVVQQRVGSVLFMFPELEHQYGLHQHTVEEELRTLHNRHLFYTPVPDVQSREWACFKRALRRFSKRIGFCNRAPLSTLVEGRSGRRRARFLQGIKEWQEEGVEFKHSRLTEMQKLEFYQEDKIAGKEDRGIQYRTVRYNAELASHLHNIAAKVIGYHRNGTFRVAKGKTPSQRCCNLFRQLARFRDPVIACGDHSRFDAHLHELIVRELHKVYLRARKYNKRLAKLLKMQLVNMGWTKGGIVYKIRGKRASGEVDTGDGNTIANDGLIEGWAMFAGLEEEDYDYTSDGDDFYIILEREKSHLFKGLVAYMLKCGMETELELVTDPFKVEFCQSRPVLLPGGPTFVRNPMKVLATLGRSPERRTRAQLQQSVRASCLCEMAMAPGSPINSVVARRVKAMLGEGKAAFNAAQSWKYEQFGMTEFQENDVEPDTLARYTFWRAWDIDESTQLQYEAMDPLWNTSLVGERDKPKKTTLKHLEAENLGVINPACECGDCPTFDLEPGMVERWL